MAQIQEGSVKSMNKRWNQLASDPSQYNRSQGVIQLSVDKNSKIAQMDLSIPGHTCTVISTESDISKGIQNFKIDKNQMRLQSTGRFVCDMKFMNVPNQIYNWKIDL
ncbi:hypothetical protein, partial [Microbacterium sp. AISO3]|uniref:hypothetical protein n=1 Tax=Microbacterium sp. AISO3 TaxID=2002831 RepID=UPI001130E323